MGNIHSAGGATFASKHMFVQGKTYSVIGPRLGSGAFDKQQLITEQDGFLPRAYAAVFNAIDAQQSDVHVQVRASCCEIYHEQVLLQCTVQTQCTSITQRRYHHRI